MKGLNKIALVAAIAAASTAQAELVAMDDAAMGATTGQAGLTIDVNSALIEIGEIQYKDADVTAPTEGGSIFITNFKMGGAGLVEAAAIQAAGGTVDPAALQDSMALDNLRINVDVAGAGEDFSNRYGLGKVNQNGEGLTFQGAINGVASGNQADFVAAYDNYVTIEDGDLVIGLDAQDQKQIVDFGMVIGQVSLGNSSMVAGDSFALASADGRSTTDNRTVLMAATALGGGIGPVDIVIKGNDTGLNINAHFALKGAIELPFVATKFGFALHNSRGLNSLVVTGVSHGNGDAAVLTGAYANVNIGKGDRDGDGTTDSLHVVVNEFSGDMDMTNITLGNTPTIGSLYITDMKVSADMNVYGH